MKNYDVAIIGAGAVGNAIARQILKKHNLSLCVLEKEPDVAFGTSGRNSGVLHAGFNNKPGTLMAKLCVQGSKAFQKEVEELGVEFKKTGKIVVARHKEDIHQLEKLMAQGQVNKVDGLKILSSQELISYFTGVHEAIDLLENCLSFETVAPFECALLSENTGIFDPFKYTIALAEAAKRLGAFYYFGRKIIDIKRDEKENYFKIYAQNNEDFSAKILINSAGLFSDQISKMLGLESYSIYPCRGEYHILEKKSGNLLTMPIYPVPNEREGGLGVHLTPTINGNIIIGPSAEYLDEKSDREAYESTKEIMEKLIKEGEELLPSIKEYSCIRSFSGVRPKLSSESKGGYADFVIEEAPEVPGYIQLLGIESPGLTSSIPIGNMAEEILSHILERPEFSINNNLTKNQERKSTKKIENKAIRNDVEYLNHKIDKKIQQNPGTQKMICRCEGITEAAVLKAYDEILELGAIPTIKGLKNRTSVTMGSCQGGFCMVNIVRLLSEKRDLDPLLINNAGFGSNIFKGRVR